MIDSNNGEARNKLRGQLTFCYICPKYYKPLSLLCEAEKEI